MVWMFLGAAFAADCPWEAVHSVDARMTSVTVNGERFDVEGPANWAWFSRVLREECDEPAAAAYLEKWRNQRRATNWSFGIGLVVTPWAWVATPFTATSAGKWRQSMVVALAES
jgi:hypothetical protein